MPYRVRVLTTSADRIPLGELQSAIDAEKLSATIEVEAGTPDQWEQLVLKHVDSTEIAVIERNVVEDGSLGAEELEEFSDEIADCKPESAVRWLLNYFPHVRCIYAFHLLSGKDHKNGWDILAAVQNRIHSFAPSILQADLEGFTNEDGYEILWQFNDSAKGTWWMGVLRDGVWVHFRMDLGNLKHREAFFRGGVPEGVELA